MSSRRTNGTVTGVVALSVALVALVGLTFMPTQYVIQRPGPIYDTLGTALNADGDEVPLIEVDDARTYPTGGTLDLTTLQVVGNRERTPTWFELALAWFDPSRAVVPLDTYFPDGVTSEQRDTRNAELMVDSQHEATAAALKELGYDVGAEVKVVEPIEGTPADGVMEPGDTVLSVDGITVDSASMLREEIQKLGGDDVDLLIERDGEEQELTLTPEETTDAAGEPFWLIGISLKTEYDFPVDVHLQLDNVGGPSAGMMFALGIIDTMTPGQLNGGENVAGTGTIEASGAVGPIGGIRQKLYGARDGGATVFLAPESNCDEVVGHIPAGLDVYSISTLEQSLEILEVIADEGDTSKLPVCTAS